MAPTTHLRIALRLLAKRPGLAAGRLLTVLTVVTAVSSVFTVANATFLRPLPFPDSERVVRLYLQPPGTTEFADANPLDQWEFARVRGRTRALERIEGIWVVERAVMADGQPEAIAAGRVSAGFFDLLGGRTVHGRTFTEEEVNGGAKLVVLGHGLWVRRFGGQPAVVGQTLLVDREPYTIVGVMNGSFEPAFAASEFWTPLTIPQGGRPAMLKAVQTVGRLAPGVDAAAARSEFGALIESLRDESPGLRGWTAGVMSLREAQYGSRRPGVLLLIAAVTALALIAIANLANLTLADVTHRRSEFAIRAALGGSRAAIVAPEFLQAMVVASVGAAGGMTAASWLVPAVLAIDPAVELHASQLALDWRVLLCSSGVAVAVMMTAVALPVLRFAGPSLAPQVVAGTQRSGTSPGAARLRVVLVAVQTALALVLLSTGALVTTAVLRSAATDPGFDPANVITAQLRLSATVFPTPRDRATFVATMLDRIREVPGVVGAATTLNPFDVGGSFQTMVQVEDRPSPDGQPYVVQYRRVSPQYFATMRIAVLSGREFDAHDSVDGHPVAIVSRGFAQRFWPDGDAVGRRLKRGSDPKQWSTVVGVVADVRDVGIDQPLRDIVYTPYAQGSNPSAPVGLVVRTAADPSPLVPAIRRAVWEVDAKQPLAHVTRLDDFLRASLGAQRFRATLVVVCSLLGLLLATIGTYGVTARAVVERTREVGIRLALGGRPARVWWTLAWTSLRGVFAGAAAGSIASSLAATLLVALLPELRGTTWTFNAAAAAILLSVGALAALSAAHTAVGGSRNIVQSLISS